MAAEISSMGSTLCRGTAGCCNMLRPKCEDRVDEIRAILITGANLSACTGRQRVHFATYVSVPIRLNGCARRPGVKVVPRGDAETSPMVVTKMKVQPVVRYFFHGLPAAGCIFTERSRATPRKLDSKSS